jgi:hypothetical protein
METSVHRSRASCSVPPTQRVQQLNCAARHSLKAPSSSLASSSPLRARPPALASARRAAPAGMSAAAAGAAGAQPLAGPAAEYAPFLEVALSAAREAGSVIAAAWDQTKTIDTKSGGCGGWVQLAAGVAVAPCCLPLDLLYVTLEARGPAAPCLPTASHPTCTPAGCTVSCLTACVYLLPACLPASITCRRRRPGHGNRQEV